MVNLSFQKQIRIDIDIFIFIFVVKNIKQITFKCKVIYLNLLN